MQFERPPRRRRNIKLEGGRRAELYPHSLQFYSIPPTENISLQDFEEFAVDRLKVLKMIENAGIKNVRSSKKYKEFVQLEFLQLRQNRTLTAVCKTHTSKNLSNDDYDDRRKDHISHFILRLAYCRSEELRRWFLQQELDLFRYRFQQETAESLQEFLQLNHLHYEPIPEKEKREILSELIQSNPNTPAHIVADNESFYKVPFTDVLDLVRGRRVFLSRGYAYVPQGELVVIILTHYRTLLSHALAVTCRAIPHLEEDDRLLPMLSNLSKRYLGQDYTNKKPSAGQITADMIDMLSRTSFPLCMQHLHQSVRSQHHLKHWGRMQYGLFLKGIGLSMDEALKFWRAEFTKAMDSDKFDKQYAYGIRHNYGKEGKRTDYTPYSCIKIITSNNPGPGDHHGCPFKHTDLDMLRQKLQNLRVSREGSEEICDLVKRGHYQVACGRYFDYQHSSVGGENNFTPNHPNQYFEESQTLINEVPKSQGTPRSVVRTKVASQSTPQSQSQPDKTAPDDGFEEDFSIEDMDQAMKATQDC